MQRTNSLVVLDRFLPPAVVLVGLTMLAVAFAADLVGAGGDSGVGPNQLALGLSGFVVLVSGIMLRSSEDRRHLGEWLLVGTGVLAVAFAADLVVVGGLPGMVAKQLLVVAVIASVLLVAVVPASARGQSRVQALASALDMDKVRAAKFVAIVAQLGLLVLLIREFELENQAFYHNILLVTFYGFLIHYFLPFEYRLPFFLFLSLAAIVGILGLANGIWLIAIGLMLIGICHLPVSFAARAVTLIVAGVGLAALRLDRVSLPWSAAIWPILGSLFMFRLIIYMHDLRHEKKPARWSQTLSYFFLLPNLVFPLFPAVDYQTFRRTYYDKDRYDVYQTGVAWILRGVVQLIVYRFVNYYLVIAPQDVANAGDLIHYLIPNLLLLVRVTGQFHLAIGILHLFGFNLPLTNDRYFLSTSFTDLWRRANIYWKDFMVKVFYYPAYFRLRSWGTIARLTAATLFAFFVTWFLHAYQWFWLRGTALLSWPDVLFWTIFALLVLGNTIYETKFGRKRTLGKKKATIGQTLLAAMRAVGVFATLAVLWSLWTSASVPEFVSLWSAVGEPLPSVLSLWPLVAIVIIAVVGTFWKERDEARAHVQTGNNSAFFRMAGVTGASILFIALVGNPFLYNAVGGKAQALMADVTRARLSAREEDLLLRGYYENLTGVNQFNSELWDLFTKRPADWPLIQETEAAHLTDDFASLELNPSTSIVFHGGQFSVNSWGMRDQEYDLIPASGTYRIALVGPSFVMGSGVSDNETFDALLETKLNHEKNSGSYDKYEILNFGVAGYSLAQELAAFEDRVLSFEPDTIFVVAHEHEEEIVVRNLGARFAKGRETPYPYLDNLAREAGIEAGMTQVEAERRLKPYGSAIVSWAYQRFVEVAHAHDIIPVWVFMPTLESPYVEGENSTLMAQAKDAGFVLMDLSSVYAGRDLEELIVAPWDKHPNATAHRLLAQLLYARMTEQQVKLGLELDPAQ